MHPYVLIPLCAAVAAGGLAGAIAVRDPSSLAHRLMALLMLCAGTWSLGSVLWCSAESAELALCIARSSALPAVAVAPLALHLLLALRPGLVPRYRRGLAFTYAVTAGVALAWAMTPWLTPQVVRTGWGFAPLFSPWAGLASATVVAVPLAALVSSLRLDAGGDEPAQRGLRALHLSVALPLAVTAATDLVLPLRGIYVPPLGSATLVVWGAAVGWLAYRFRGAGLSPGCYAREILETLATGVLLLRVDGRIRASNARLLELAGCARSEILGRSITSLLSGSCAAMSDAQREVECELRGASGESIPVAISHAPLRDGDADVIGYVLAVHDLREVASLRSRLLTSGRLAAVGQLAAGIAHEINNPLAYVRSNLRMLERHWPELEARALKAGGDAIGSGEAALMIAECREGVERVAAIVRDVGGFAREGPPTLESADVAELLETALRVATPQLRGRATLERDYAAIPRVRCVPQELMQVFLNLVLNAAQALERGGTIRLATECRDADVYVQVEDDGRGLPDADVERLFDPFFTTKPAGEGTGLGLAISRQIVTRHGGEIGARPRPGGGSVFWLRLPVGGPV